MSDSNSMVQITVRHHGCARDTLSVYVPHSNGYDAAQILSAQFPEHTVIVSSAARNWMVLDMGKVTRVFHWEDFYLRPTSGDPAYQDYINWIIMIQNTPQRVRDLVRFSHATS